MFQEQAHGEAIVGFPNVRKLYILNGEFELTPRGARKVKIEPLFSSKDDPTVLKRGEALSKYSITASPARPDGQALKALVGAPELPIQKLRINALGLIALEHFEILTSTFRNLTSLRLRFLVRWETDTNPWHTATYEPRITQNYMRRGYLKNFLKGLLNLESLRLDLGEHYFDERMESAPWIAHSRIDDVFCTEHTWPSLRKLSLRFFDTTYSALASLLERHGATLKDLRLHNIFMERDDTHNAYTWKMWVELLQKIQSTTHLEKVVLSGTLGLRDKVAGDEKQAWNLPARRDLTLATAQYLVHGGECPLNEFNVSDGIAQDTTERII